MSVRLFLRALAGCVLATQARAETPPPPRPPMLHLSASATIRAAPDELVADLTGLGIAADAVAAQRRVNEMMQRALQVARTVPGVSTVFRDYSATLTEDHPPRWAAQQTLELRGRDGDTLLELVGRLQGLGLVIGGLTWQVSPEHAATARQEAVIAALRTLRQNAAADAEALGLAVDGLQDVRVGSGLMPLAGRVQPRGMVAMAAAMPPPNATPEAQDVTAEVNGDVVLKPAP
ncbi:MAG TPA: SIMPL domain-containing protein [Acetobacteraceae bacterium]|nr:SIMPL domain-containing protein [Acetobacteraceae bacterium]